MSPAPDPPATPHEEPFRQHDPIRHLFVYGTLRPGDVRWPLLARFVVDTGRDDTVSGQLYDTGRDYPAAVFDTDRSVIHGRTYALSLETIERCLDVLDVEEGTVAGLYRRVVVTTGSGTVAYAYAYGDGLELTPIDSGDWFEHRSPGRR